MLCGHPTDNLDLRVIILKNRSTLCQIFIFYNLWILPTLLVQIKICEDKIFLENLACSPRVDFLTLYSV